MASKASNLVAMMASGLIAMASNLTAKASNQIATVSNLIAMASNLIATASNLIAMASNLIAMASNLRAMASNLIAMASNLIAEVVISLVSNGCREEVVGWHPKLSFLLPLIFPFGSTSVYYGCGQKRTTPFHENPPPTDTVEGIK